MRFDNKITARRIHRSRCRHRRLSLTTAKLSLSLFLSIYLSLYLSISISVCLPVRAISLQEYRQTAGFPDEFARARFKRIVYACVCLDISRAILIPAKTTVINYYARRMRARRPASRGSRSIFGTTRRTDHVINVWTWINSSENGEKGETRRLKSRQVALDSDFGEIVARLWSRRASNITRVRKDEEAKVKRFLVFLILIFLTTFVMFR